MSDTFDHNVPDDELLARMATVSGVVQVLGDLGVEAAHD